MSPCLSWQRPIAIFGQNAKAEGRAQWVEGTHNWGREVVGVNFVEQLFLYCADERFRDDVGFFILEQDFRFYAADCTAVQRLRAKGLREKIRDGSVQPRTKIRSEEEPTPELRDLLCYITAARRWVTDRCPHGHHNLMWMSWEPKLRKSDCPHYHWPPHRGEFRNNTPGTGNYMWYITARGARHIKRTVLALPACLHTRWSGSVQPRSSHRSALVRAARLERIVERRFSGPSAPSFLQRKNVPALKTPPPHWPGHSAQGQSS